MSIDKARVCHDIAMEYAKKNLQYVLDNRIPIFSGFEEHEVMLISYRFAYNDLMENFDEVIKRHADRLAESNLERLR